MPALTWDNPEDRMYESGLDRGVLYLPDGTGVVWNGLISIAEKLDRTTTPVYFDGMKIGDLVSLGDFSATMKAVTYPDEFIEVEGAGDFRPGVFLTGQKPQAFALCYRTSLGDDAAGDLNGYKLHLLYNVTAIPHEKTFASISNAPNLVEFEWDIFAVPEETAGFRPTAHIVIDSRDVDPLLLFDIEALLYGIENGPDPTLIPMATLVSFMQAWFRIRITDNGDGTWTAEIHDGLQVLSWLDDPTDILFSLTEANAIFSIDGTQYTISDTIDSSDIAEIKIHYNIEDGSWSATSDSDILVAPEVGGEFEILNANAIFIGVDTYRISDTGIDY